MGKEKIAPEKFNNLAYFAFALITALVGFNWFMWGPLLGSFIEPTYHVSGFLLALFITSVPIMLVLLSYSTGSLADTDVKKTTIIAALIMAITVIIRPFTIGNFYALLTIQIIFATSAVFCFTSWAPLTYRLFKKEKAAFRVAGLTASLTLGQIITYLITYPLVKKFGFFNILLVYAAITAVIAILYIIVIRMQEFMKQMEAPKRPSFVQSLKIVLSEKAMIPLMIIAFLDIGVFAWLAGWYPAILTKFKGITPTEAGIVHSMILVGCLIGAMTVPNISHHIKKVKIFLVTLPIICIIMLLLIPRLSGLGSFIINGIILGFALFPMYPLGVHLPSAYSKIGVAYAGVSSGIVLIAANLGGFILPELGALTRGITSAIVLFGIVPMALMFIAALFFKDPDTYK